jgi:hypothetical protein
VLVVIETLVIEVHVLVEFITVGSSKRHRLPTILTRNSTSHIAALIAVTVAVMLAVYSVIDQVTHLRASINDLYLIIVY